MAIRSVSELASGVAPAWPGLSALIDSATADSILEKVRRGRVALNQSAKTETHH